MQLSVAIYNSAGELVKQLYNGKSQGASSQSLSLNSNAFMALSGTVSLSVGGMLPTGGNSLSWNGSNDQGQGVSGGMYYFKVQIIDPFGGIQTWSQSIAVMPPPPSQYLNIYNSAGELVAHLGVASPSGKPLNSLAINNPDNKAFALGAGGGVNFSLADTSGQLVPVHWNGKTDSGGNVGQGSYTAQLVDEGSGGTVVMTKGFVLLADPHQGQFSVIEGPNPVSAADHQMIFQLSGLGSSSVTSVLLYNLAGELVAQGSAAPGSSQIVVTCGSWSSGIYVADVRVMDGQAVLSRKILKIAMQR
jgi:hypothetical protein